MSIGSPGWQGSTQAEPSQLSQAKQDDDALALVARHAARAVVRRRRTAGACRARRGRRCRCGSSRAARRRWRGQSSQSGQLGTQTQMSLGVAAGAVRVAGVELAAAVLRIEAAVAVGVDQGAPAVGELDHLVAAGDQRGAGGREHGAHRGAALGVGRGGAHQAPRHFGDHVGGAVVADDDRHDELHQVAVHRLGEAQRVAAGGEAGDR